MRRLLLFLAITVLLALMITGAAVFPFDFLSPAWFFFAAIVVERLRPRPEDDRLAPVTFFAAVPLRAPPVR